MRLTQTRSIHNREFRERSAPVSAKDVADCPLRLANSRKLTTMTPQVNNVKIEKSSVKVYLARINVRDVHALSCHASSTRACKPYLTTRTSGRRG